jgi:uncharacterized membrane protein YhaH (DUF805 family)
MEYQPVTDERMDDLTHAPAIAGDPSEVPRYFSLSQRIGRLRYFVYVLSGMVCSSILLLMMYLFCLALPLPLAKLVFDVSLVLIKYILIPMIVIVMTVRRLHDIDFNGWWAMLIIIPFLNIILLFVPGTASSNRFGPTPRENTAAIKTTAIALPMSLLLLFLGLKDAPTHREQTQTHGSGQLRDYRQ